MEVIFLPKAQEGLSFWIKSKNAKILKKISQLTASIIENPTQGIGKPEGLKHQLSGKWSRRISLEHRYIYQIEANKINVFSLRGRY